MRSFFQWGAGLICGLALTISSSFAADAPRNFSVNENLYGVQIASDQAWIVGYYGTILHSADRGVTWQEQPSPTRNALFSIRYVGRNNAWINGSHGTLLSTLDGGKTWRAPPTDTTDHLLGSFWLDETHGWIAGSRGVTLRTDDGGNSWQKTVVPGDFSFSAVWFANPLRGWVAGEFGVKALLAGHTGARSCFVATRRIETMSALAGEKACVRGLARDVARGLGLEPVAVSGADLVAAMARGDILAAEWGGAIASHSLGLHTVASFSAGTSINRHGTALSLGMRRAFWDGLGAGGQAMFAAAAAELQLALAEEDAHRNLLWPQPSAAQTWPLAGELAHAIRRVADAVVAHAAGSDAPARRINASYESFRRVALGDGISAPGRETA